ncbi:tetratricopeptide repeat protein [Thermococcus onnurineus]|nr:tetratricopeptide repeat protein [Thermococcus onnurineus]
MRILEQQFGDKFIGRTEELRRLTKIIHNRDKNIILVTGERGIGKTNFLKVAAKQFEEQQYKVEYFHGGLIQEEVEEHWFGSFIKRLTSLSLPVIGGGLGWEEKPTTGKIYSYLSKLKKRTVIFIEDAHKLDRQFLELIQIISEINPSIFFVLEGPIEWSKKINFKPGGYSVIRLRRLTQEQIQELVTKIFPQLPPNIVSIITNLSEGIPYVARVLAYICNKKNSEEEMIKFLLTLEDPETRTSLDKIHQEILDSLSIEARELLKRLAFAPEHLTLKLINAFGRGIENLDDAFRELRERGILIQEELQFDLEVYRIYHSLFEVFIRDQYPLTSKAIAETYRKATKYLNSEYSLDEIYFENLMLILGIMELEITKKIGYEKILTHIMAEIKDPSVLLRTAKEYWLQGYPDKSLGILSKLLEIIDEKEDPILHILMLQHMGVAYRLIGEIDKALTAHKEALRISRSLRKRNKEKDKDKEIEMLISQQYINIGNIYLMKKELDKAEESFRKALEISEKIEDEERQVSAILSLGNIQKAKGNIKKQLELYLKGLKLLNNLERNPSTYLDLDEIQRKKGNSILGN